MFFTEQPPTGENEEYYSETPGSQVGTSVVSLEDREEKEGKEGLKTYTQTRSGRRCQLDNRS
jgi:hypothetical protein